MRNFHCLLVPPFVFQQLESAAAQTQAFLKLFDVGLDCWDDCDAESVVKTRSVLVTDHRSVLGPFMK